MIFSSDEKLSQIGSKTLVELIEESQEIRNSLILNGFITIVQRTLDPNLILSNKPSSSPKFFFQQETTIPYHIKIGILDVVHKLAEKSEVLKPMSSLIPVLEDLKINGLKDLKKKSGNILGILNSNGIKTAPIEQQLENKIQSLEEE
ncbi:MAG: hypothetical protein EZS28_056095, partial [Streblomastix strix]